MSEIASGSALLDDAAILKSILENVATGIVVCDQEGKLLCFNREAERILGMGHQQVGPAEWSGIYGCFHPDMVTAYRAEEFPLARAVAGQEVRHELMFIRNPRQPQGVWISVSSRPFADRAGARRGAVAVFHDVTAAEALLRRDVSKDGAAGDATRLLGVSEILQSLERYRSQYIRIYRAVEQTADAVVITNHQALIEYVNPAFEAITGYPASEVLGRNPKLLKSGLHDPQFYAAMWGALRAGEPFRGTIVNRRKSGELFWAEQTITPVKDSSERTTHFVSVMKDVTEERKQREQEFYLGIAREVQERFHRFVDAVPGYDVAGSIHPAALTGGDYFDLIPHPDGRLTIAIGDVSGHGFGAALLMAETRAYVRAFSSRDSEPREVLECVNRALIGDLDGSQFVTLLLARLDPERRAFEYASAGHLPGYLLDGAGQVTLALQSTGPPLGLFSAAQFSSSGGIPYQEGETLVLLTDGVTEAASPGGEEFSAGRALEVVPSRRGQSAREIAEAICAAARDFRGGAPPADDMTAVVCRPGPGTDS